MRVMLAVHYPIEYQVWAEWSPSDDGKVQQGGIIRNGEDYAGFWATGRQITDYDMVVELSKGAIAALKVANFDPSEVDPSIQEPNNV